MSTVPMVLPRSAPVTGYWLASIPGKGFGIVRATGPLGGTPHARFLGVNRSEVNRGVHNAAASLGDHRIYEVGGGVPAMIDTALKRGSAWATGPASVSWDVLPTAIFTGVVTAGAGLFLLGGGAAAAGGAAEVGGGAAAGGVGSGTAAAGGAAAGSAAKSIGGAAKKLVGGAAKTAARNPLAAAGALSIAGLFTNVSWWKGIGLIVAGAILVILAIRELT